MRKLKQTKERSFLGGATTALVCLALLSLLLLQGRPVFSLASWQAVADSFQKNFLAENRYMMVVKGVKNTILMTAGASLLGIIIGLTLSLIRVAYNSGAKIYLLNQIANLYITVIRGTPMMVQLLIWNFTIFGSIRNANVLLIATLGFGVNSGAYVAEIFRAGLEAIDRGQLEAARSLGLSYGTAMKLVMLPQALKNSLPVLINEFISLVKETSIAGYIAVDELTRAAQNIQSITYEHTQPLLLAAGIYLLIVLATTKLMYFVQNKLQSA